MKLLTKINIISCFFSGISVLSVAYAYACSETPTVAKVEENKKTNGWFDGTKEYDFSNYGGTVPGEKEIGL